MASRYNSFNLKDNPPVDLGGGVTEIRSVTGSGLYENVQEYAGVNIKIVAKAGVTGTVGLRWFHANGRTEPSLGAMQSMATEEIAVTGNETIFRSYTHKSRWFYITYNFSGVVNLGDVLIFTKYTKTNSNVEFIDNSGNILNFSSDALPITLTDDAGNTLGTLADNDGKNPLNVHLKDVSLSDNGSIYVNLMGENDESITSGSGTLFVSSVDASGKLQASTYPVRGLEESNGVSLFASLTDNDGYSISTTGTSDGSINALFVNLSDNEGNSYSESNPLPVALVRKFSHPFDFSLGITEQFICPSLNVFQDLDNSINIMNLFLYNDTATTKWAKIYDISAGDIFQFTAGSDADISFNAVAEKLKVNLPVQGYSTRDVSFPEGVTFSDGVYARATTSYENTSTEEVGSLSVFLGGTYIQHS